MAVESIPLPFPFAIDPRERSFLLFIRIRPPRFSAPGSGNFPVWEIEISCNKTLSPNSRVSPTSLHVPEIFFKKIPQPPCQNRKNML